ncbi:MAG: hypothetical protein ACKVVP_08740 [Chloroflexota bacterium]
MRIRTVPAFIALVVSIPLLTPQPSILFAESSTSTGAALRLRAAPASAAAESLPDEASIRRVLAPMTVANFTVHSATGEGWDVMENLTATGGTGSGPEVPVMISIAGAELPTMEGAAGFAQTKLQYYRDAVRMIGIDGQLGPAGDTLTMDADEAYFGAFMTPAGASDRILTAILLARYDSVVTSVEVTMMWNTPGTISEDSQAGVGMITGALAALVNELAS